jgi:hypothetical protein
VLKPSFNENLNNNVTGPTARDVIVQMSMCMVTLQINVPCQYAPLYLYYFTIYNIDYTLYYDSPYSYHAPFCISRSLYPIQHSLPHCAVYTTLSTVCSLSTHSVLLLAIVYTTLCTVHSPFNIACSLLQHSMLDFLLHSASISDAVSAALLQNPLKICSEITS